MNYLTPYEELFEPLFHRVASSDKSSCISLYETQDHVVVEAAVPGIEPEHLSISLEKGILSIEGSQKKEERKGAKVHKELYADYRYRIALPCEIDEKAEPEASCKNGIVKVSFAKSKGEQPRKIAVRS